MDSRRSSTPRRCSLARPTPSRPSSSRRGTSRRIRSGSGSTSTRSQCWPRCSPTGLRKYFPDYRHV